VVVVVVAGAVDGPEGGSNQTHLTVITSTPRVPSFIIASTDRSTATDASSSHPSELRIIMTTRPSHTQHHSIFVSPQQWPDGRNSNNSKNNRRLHPHPDGCGERRCDELRAPLMPLCCSGRRTITTATTTMMVLGPTPAITGDVNRKGAFGTPSITRGEVTDDDDDDDEETDDDDGEETDGHYDDEATTTKSIPSTTTTTTIMKGLPLPLSSWERRLETLLPGG
jgi:hypothetical protein